MKKVFGDLKKCMYCGKKFKEKDILPFPESVRYSMRTRPMCPECYLKVDY